MADVEMQDAGSAAPAKAKAAGKIAKTGGAEASDDNKKRFEVKKVSKHGFSRRVQY